MSINEERKQIAIKLRELGSDITEDKFFHWDDAVCASWHMIVKTVGVDNENPYDDHRELCNRLADLIDPKERVLTLTPGEICPECGKIIGIHKSCCCRCGTERVE